jgi:hypothetical protein
MYSKEKVTEYFQEWMDTSENVKSLRSQAKKQLKEVQIYNEVVEEKKRVDLAIKEIEDSNPLIEQIKKENDSIGMIKESLSEELDLKKGLVSKLFSFYKSMFLKGEDELDEITTRWVELFEDLKGE